MAIKFGTYRLHAVTQQLIYRPFELADDPHSIPEFIEREWVVQSEEEYYKMLHEVEERVNNYYSQKWASKKSHAAMEICL